MGKLLKKKKPDLWTSLQDMKSSVARIKEGYSGSVQDVRYKKTPNAKEEKKYGPGYSEGGDVFSGKQRASNERGVNKQWDKGKSIAGVLVRHNERGAAKESHKRTLEELKSMKNPKLLAHGGMADYQSSCTHECVQPCEVHQMGEDLVGQVLAKRMADGGKVDYGRGDESKQEGVHVTNYQGHGNSPAGSYVKAIHKKNTSVPDHVLLSAAKDEHKRVISEMKRMKGPHGNYSEGGVIANEDEPIADSMPNEFDYLELEGGMEEHYTAANSGDRDGDPDPDKEHNEMVARAMMKRKKQHNPRPA